VLCGNSRPWRLVKTSFHTSLGERRWSWAWTTPATHSATRRTPAHHPTSAVLLMRRANLTSATNPSHDGTAVHVALSPTIRQPCRRGRVITIRRVAARSQRRLWRLVDLRPPTAGNATTRSCARNAPHGFDAAREGPDTLRACRIVKGETLDDFTDLSGWSEGQGPRRPAARGASRRPPRFLS
jgi:hypothetical protein